MGAKWRLNGGDMEVNGGQGGATPVSFSCTVLF